MPILADTKSAPVNPSDAMKSAIVKPMPPRNAAPPRMRQVTPSGRAAHPSFTVTHEAPKIPTDLPKNKPAATAMATGSPIPATSNGTPALASAKSGMMPNATHG